MSILTDLTDHVIGVDPDRDTFSAAIVHSKSLGSEIGERFTTRAGGYTSVLEWADTHTDADRRAWAIEGSGTYGKGLAQALHDAGEWVIEFSFPNGPAAPDGAKTDNLDAIRAAREVLGRTKHATPRNADGDSNSLASILGLRELLTKQRTQMINHLKSLLLRAPAELRDQLRDLTNANLIRTCASLRPSKDPANLFDETTNTKMALRLAAKGIQTFNKQIQELYQRLDLQTETKAPHLRAEHGVGPCTAAAILIAWSHKGRIPTEAKFAKLAGACPIPIDSGANQGQHRLNRSGDRQLNRALHTVVLSRARTHQETRTYMANKKAQGRTPRHARRCLKRVLARQFYRLLENPPTTT